MFQTAWMALSPYQNLCTFLDSPANVRLHALVLSYRHHGTDRRFRIGGVSDRKGVHGVDDGPLDLSKTAVRHEQPGTRCTGLPAVHEGDAKGHRNRFAEVGIVEKDVGRLATQLQRDSLQ